MVCNAKSEVVSIDQVPYCACFALGKGIRAFVKFRCGIVASTFGPVEVIITIQIDTVIFKFEESAVIIVVFVVTPGSVTPEGFRRRHHHAVSVRIHQWHEPYFTVIDPSGDR